MNSNIVVDLVESTVLHAIACDLKSLDELPMMCGNSNNSAAKVSAGNPQPQKGEESPSLTEVHLSFNTIDSQSLVRFSRISASLHTLILDNNELQNVASLPRPPLLQRLWLNNNSLANLDDVLSVVVRQCSSLLYLSLLRNQCCPSELDGHLPTEYKRYRLYVKYMLPTLLRLDTAEFTETETQEAKTKGKFARPEQAEIISANVLPLAPAAAATVGTGSGDVDVAAAVPVPLARSGISGSGMGIGEKKERQVDLFAEFDQKRREGPGAVTHFSGNHKPYSGRGSEGNRFIGDDML
ncbi:hypothetical protein LSM04_009436 [Trypanosoma melophagium]|uniref:uncharacterized protein n=1 Tax=Trypanosoma melophagium TaxID=715481 RepID=UPI00351A322F|nr:hypothetical protein LSM04_009436 [Trypanosoma melophagium]